VQLDQEFINMDSVYDLVVFDMAGTTVLDDGLVERAFGMALDEVGCATEPVERGTVLDFVRTTMGQSKILVFTQITGDASAAQIANDAFERAYDSLVRAGELQPIIGARETIAALRAAGMSVVLTTGFSSQTQRGILDALGWQDVADLALSPADAGGRGRPHPDLNLTALIRTRRRAVASMVVVGDTSSDMVSGVRAGAGRVVGVLSGAHDEATLREAGATDILRDVTGLPELLGLSFVAKV
jgi:phosphoglycolate phosphatase